MDFGVRPQNVAYSLATSEAYCELCEIFEFLTVSVVKICKQCLHTASTSGELRPLNSYQGFATGGPAYPGL